MPIGSKDSRTVVSLAEQGKYEEAIKDFDKAIELDTSSVEAWYNKVLALYYQRNYSQAIERYDEVLELDSSISSLV
ncbi:MAG: tetratricopeptide repeat protein [Methanotrichaceae archaeon]